MVPRWLPFFLLHRPKNGSQRGTIYLQHTLSFSFPSQQKTPFLKKKKSFLFAHNSNNHLSSFRRNLECSKEDGITTDAHKEPVGEGRRADLSPRLDNCMQL